MPPLYFPSHCHFFQPFASFWRFRVKTKYLTNKSWDTVDSTRELMTFSLYSFWVPVLHHVIHFSKMTATCWYLVAKGVILEQDQSAFGYLVLVCVVAKNVLLFRPTQRIMMWMTRNFNWLGIWSMRWRCSKLHSFYWYLRCSWQQTWLNTISRKGRF